MAYDIPNATVRREYFAGSCGGDPTTVYGKFRSFQKMRLKKVHCVVTTAGTTDAHALDVYSGTTSIGTVLLGTNTAGSVISSTSNLNTDFASMVQLSVKTKADGDGIADVTYEFEVQHDATQS